VRLQPCNARFQVAQAPVCAVPAACQLVAKPGNGGVGRLHAFHPAVDALYGAREYVEGFGLLAQRIGDHINLRRDPVHRRVKEVVLVGAHDLDLLGWRSANDKFSSCLLMVSVEVNFQVVQAQVRSCDIAGSIHVHEKAKILSQP